MPSMTDAKGLESSPSDERLIFAKANARNRTVLEPRINIYWECLEVTIVSLRDFHQLVAERDRSVTKAKTRSAATWLVCGQAIGLAQAAIDLVRAGYTGHCAPTLRSLHEATRLLSVFALRGEDALVDRWLDNKHVSRGDIMAASDRQEEAMRIEMVKAGVPPVSTTRSYFERQYGQWSEIVHHRRAHMVDLVSPPQLLMVTGPHPDWRARAVAVEHVTWYVIELVSVSSSALGKQLGSEVHDELQATFEQILRLTREVPLDKLVRSAVAPIVDS